jgi:dTDP-4-amino-4,6-dideoxygalactose transaminase
LRVPFNKPYTTGKELRYVQQAIDSGALAGDGVFGQRCQAWLEEQTGAKKALLTHSCTAALEMCALLLELEPGDEVIMPSYTFVSTANAFVLRGAVPVFVDVRADTLNIDERLIEAAITEKTKAICVVHYAGVGCEMDAIVELAARHGLPVIEDSAHASLASYRGRPLGGLGALATLSFHETKNLVSGEGGALLVNDPRWAARAEILWQKGTNRQAFSRGEVDKYSWVDLGSSFLAGELTAAFLWGQIEDAEAITRRRLEVWQRYHHGLAPLEERGLLRRPVIPPHCVHNAHMFYVLVPSVEARTAAIAALAAEGIHAVFHYVPLHSAPAGRRLGRVSGAMSVTNDTADRILRLPLWVGLPADVVESVVAVLSRTLASFGARSSA